MKPVARPPTIDRRPIPLVGKVIAVGSGKGGVGKSSVTVNLAHALTAQGKKVGILDADIYGPSIPRMLGLETRLKPEFVDSLFIPPLVHGIRVMSMSLIGGDEAAVLRAPMVTKALLQFLRLTRWATMREPLDVLLIDLPPGTGDILLSLVQNVPLTGALIVTTPQDIAIADADKCASAFTKLQVPILGIIENMSYFATPSGEKHLLFGAGGGAKLARKYGTTVLGDIPLEPPLGIAGDRGKNFISQQPNSVATAQFLHLASVL